jgi:hypothetical protein
MIPRFSRIFQRSENQNTKTHQNTRIHNLKKKPLNFPNLHLPSRPPQKKLSEKASFSQSSELQITRVIHFYMNVFLTN